MKIALFAAFLCLAAALPKVRQVENLNNPKRLAGEFLVVLHPTVSKASNFRYTNNVAAKIAAISSKIDIVKMFTSLRSPTLYIKTSDETIMSQLFQLHEVNIVEANVQQHMIEQCSTQSTGSRLWGLSRVSSRQQPSYPGAEYSFDQSGGANVRVYVHDTGIRTTHNDFQGRSEFGANFVGGGNDDVHGHGTHCAGTVMGGEFGVSKAADSVAVKVLGDSGSGSTAGIIEGLNWMVADVAQRGVRGVGSMSLGGGFSSAMNAAVDSADAADVPVVVAAGNSDWDACSFSPASAEGAITVGATDNTDSLSSYSNWGSCVDILAPGSNILSCGNSNDFAEATMSGTSMACPHVAGLVANYLGENPDASSAQVKSYLDSSSTPDVIDLRGTSGTPNLNMYAVC